LHYQFSRDLRPGRRKTVIKNYFMVVIRYFRRHKGFAAIDLGGLAVGLAACLLIGLYVKDELSFDRFNTKAGRIYRLGQGSVGWPYGRIIASEFPEVERVVYMRAWPSYSIEHEKHHLFERMLYADPGFFKVFDFPALEGNAGTALDAPYDLVLSETLARKLFAGAPAVGRTLYLGGERRPFTVQAVVRVPAQSHIQFGALLSFDTLRAEDPAMYKEEMEKGWLDLNVINYVLLKEGADARAFAAKIRDLPAKYAAGYLKDWGSKYQLGLEPMKDIYLRSRFGNWLGPKSDISYVILLGCVGLFLLLIAGVNFVNLATARSIERAKEVGVRKAVGSTRAALVRQFLTESFLVCLLAVALAVGLVTLLLPYFNSLAARSYASADFFKPSLALALFGLAGLVGLLAGLYPALSLSNFRPIEVLRGRFSTGRRGVRLRQGLVVFQFAISAVLVLATLVVLGQLRFMQRQNLGFELKQVIVLDARRAPAKEFYARAEAFKNALASYPAVESISSTWAVPGRDGWPGQISFPEGWPAGKSITLEFVPVDYDFVKTIGLKVIAGRDFDRSFPTDADKAVLINRAAAEEAGWTTPAAAVGKKFTSPGSGKPDSIVIGVLENYHHHGLKQKIGSMMFGINSAKGLYAIRYRASETAGLIGHLTKTWSQFFEGYPTSYFFLDDDFARQYEGDRRLMRIFGTFTLLTIMIAGLGLFGLAAFTTLQRTKEIGVRKVLGATSSNIVTLLSKEFLKPVVIAFVLAAPVGYYAMRRWLENFAYRTGIGAGVFVIGAALLLVVSLGTVGYQALRAALADPAESIRYE
jgi:putative ABC transport system permease protein